MIVGTYIRMYVGRSIYIPTAVPIYIHTHVRARVECYLPTYAPPQQKAKNFHAFIQNRYPPPGFWSVFVWWVLTSNGYITHYPRICVPRHLVSVCAELMLHAKLLQPSRSKGFSVFSVKMLTFLPIINKKKISIYIVVVVGKNKKNIFFCSKVDISTLKMDNMHRINNLRVFESTFSRHWTDISRHKSTFSYIQRSKRRQTNYVMRWLTDGKRYIMMNNEE
jgi:hypothetical protein